MLEIPEKEAIFGKGLQKGTVKTNGKVDIAISQNKINKALEFQLDFNRIFWVNRANLYDKVE